MTINGVKSESSGVQVKGNYNGDNISKNIQKQIEELKKQIQKLAENDEMEPKLKSEKKKELEQKISELQNQLSMRRAQIIEEQKEKIELKNQADNEKSFMKKENRDIYNSSFTKSITDLNNAYKTAGTLNGIRCNLKSQTGILESEIKLDGGRGASTEYKHKKLYEIKYRISKIDNDIGEKLGYINDSKNSIYNNVDYNDNSFEDSENNEKSSTVNKDNEYDKIDKDRKNNSYGFQN